jgi:hypothetical protein
VLNQRQAAFGSRCISNRLKSRHSSAESANSGGHRATSFARKYMSQRRSSNSSTYPIGSTLPFCGTFARLSSGPQIEHIRDVGFLRDICSNRSDTTFESLGIAARDHNFRSGERSTRSLVPASAMSATGAARSLRGWMYPSLMASLGPAKEWFMHRPDKSHRALLGYGHITVIPYS